MQVINLVLDKIRIDMIVLTYDLLFDTSSDLLAG